MFGGELTWRSLIRSISFSRESSCVNGQLYREGKWFVAFSPEFPEANGQGETEEACIESLKQAIDLLLEDRRKDARQNLPTDSQLVEIV